MSPLPSGEGGQDSASRTTGRFATTHWSVVLQAGGTTGRESQQALEQLCRAYWYPLYAFARRRGASAAEAQDLTQGFFVHVLESALVNKADPLVGKFRSFLLSSFQHYVAHEEDRARAQKRGGGRAFSIDGAAAEQWFGLEPATQETAERLFERSWATQVLEQALEQLKGEFKAAGKASVFQELSPLLEGEKVEGGYAGLACKLDVVEGTIKWMVHRMRNRYRELIHTVIADAVASPEQVEEEVQHLIAVLRN